MGFKIRTIIIDDEQDGRDVLQNLLAFIPEIELIAIVNDADSGLDAIQNMLPDLVFLDIRMPRKSGLEMMIELAEKQINTTIVFVTAYDKFAIQAIKLAAFDYLLKPVDLDELKRVIQRFDAEKQVVEFGEKILLLMEKLNHGVKIRLNTRTGFTLIDPIDIVYLQAEGKYTEIIFSQNRKELITQQLGTLVEVLPKGRFFQTSRSNLINLAYLRKVDRKAYKCELERNGDTFVLQISKDFLGDFMQMVSQT